CDGAPCAAASTCSSAALLDPGEVVLQQRDDEVDRERRRDDRPQRMSCQRRCAARIRQYAMKPKPIPLEMFHVNGITMITSAAGMPTATSRKSIPASARPRRDRLLQLERDRA